MYVTSKNTFESNSLDNLTAIEDLRISWFVL